MLERLKEKADELGIKYRSDIKEDTLLAKIEAFEPPEPEPQKEPEYLMFKNTSKINVFTEGGRCAPNKSVSLSKEEAEKYAGLEQCNT